MEIDRILFRFDSLMSGKEFDEAERLLCYWIEECELNKDDRNRFTLLNELTGFYRMRSDREKGTATAEKLLESVRQMGLSEKVSGATAYINAATAYKSFNESEKAILLYEKAKTVYEDGLEQNDDRLPALYNNMALTVMSLGEKYYEKAEELFEKALDLLKNIRSSENEQAITVLNMIDLKVMKAGSLDIADKDRLINKAKELLEKSYNDGNPDFKMTAEKCIPVFKHYGFAAIADFFEGKIRSLE